mgnify:CR=1 FL=1|tara:strand:+ start:1398 stop:1847 length:450 start_codon:yes stop_codon:yes gene_type:complete
MAYKVLTDGEIVRGIKGQYSGKVYVVVDRKNVMQIDGVPPMPNDYREDLTIFERGLEWTTEVREKAKKEGRYFMYTLKNKDSTIKVWDYLLTGAGGNQPQFSRIAVDELTKNNAIARRRQATQSKLNRFKHQTNTPYDKYDKGPAGSNA